MKIFTKICFSIAAVAAGLGIVAIIIGIAMGAKAEDLNEMGIYISPYHQVRVTEIQHFPQDTFEETLEKEAVYEHHGETIQHHNGK